MTSTKKPRRVPDGRYEVGEIVVVTTDTRATRAVGSGTRTLRSGTRLEISRVGSGWVRARIASERSYSYVWSVDERVVAPIDRPLRHFGDAPADGVSVDDPALDWLWRDVAELAERWGYCSEFDRLADALGIPGRTRSFSVSIQVAHGIVLRGTIEARSYAEAERTLIERTRAGVQRGPLALESAVS